ncbi:hypothetical protein [Pantoea ananatis]|uniref:hypothetical protein n=1 Tax=Pantoea ananas TaxID=553 RepID=UPI00234FFAA8|nr:hypothetical protein [Pantoea ananatis]
MKKPCTKVRGFFTSVDLPDNPSSLRRSGPDASLYRLSAGNDEPEAGHGCSGEAT